MTPAQRYAIRMLQGNDHAQRRLVGLLNGRSLYYGHTYSMVLRRLRLTRSQKGCGLDSLTPTGEVVARHFDGLFSTPEDAASGTGRGEKTP